MPQRGNVHDVFFKQSFSEPGVAADFVRQYLPADVVATLDLDSIQLLSGSFVADLSTQLVAITSLLRHHPDRALVQTLHMRLLFYVMRRHPRASVRGIGGRGVPGRS